MTTISIVIQAIDRASRVFGDVTRAAEKMAVAEDLARKVTDSLTKAVEAGTIAEEAATAAIEKLGRVYGEAARATMPLTRGLNTVSRVGGLAAMALKAGADAAGQEAWEMGLAAKGADLLSEKFTKLTTKASLAALALEAEAVAAEAATMADYQTLVASEFRGEPSRLVGGLAKFGPFTSGTAGYAPSLGRTGVTYAQSGPSVLSQFFSGFTAGRAGAGGGGGGNWGAAGLLAGAAFGRGWWGGFGRVGRTMLPLFGGIFGSAFFVSRIGGFHLLADSILEIAAVLIPASIALAAFGIAGSDAFKKIGTQFQNMHTVMDATGKAISPMTNALEKAHKAANPQVYQLLGDAITVVNKRAGAFAIVAKAAGTVVDQLGARIAAALRSGNFSKWIHDAVPDLKLLGTIVGNVFGIVGNLLQAIPGYAKYIFGFIASLTALIETVTHLLEPVIAWGLAMHGAIIWIGLLTTIGVFLINRFIVPAITWLTVLVMEVGFLAAAGDTAGAAMLFLQKTGGTIFWIALAVSALGFLIYKMVTARSATQDLTSALQKGIDNASTISQGFLLVGQAQHKMSQQVVTDTKALADTQKYADQVNLHTGISSRGVSAAYTIQAQKLAEAKAGMAKFNAEATYNRTHLQQLAVAYGHGTNALGLLNAAGITQTQWQDHSVQGWIMIQQQVAATVAGYQAMGQKAGTLGNDLDVLNKLATDQFAAMQKLNSAWAQQTGLVTGAAGAFDTFALGQIALQSNFKQTAAHAQTVANSLDHLHITVPGVGAVMDGLTQQSLSLNQAFGQQVVNADALFGTWRQAGIASNLFTTGVKDTIRQLLPFAKGSKDATAELITLAEEAGYKGPALFRKLVEWLGKAHGGTRALQRIAFQATQQEALLTGALGAQASFIESTLLNDLSKAEILYSGVAGDMTAWGKAIAQQGAASDAARGARRKLIDDMLTFGQRTHKSTGEIVAMLVEFAKIPKKLAIQIVANAEGQWKITGSGGPGRLPGTKVHPKSALGGYVTAGTTSTADDVVTRVSKGELIVPTKMVSAGLVDHLRGSIPGFAQGGVVGSYSSHSPAGLGSWVVGKYNETVLSIASATAQAAITAAKAAQIAAAALGAFAGGPGGGAPSANAALARRMMPSWGSGIMWTAWNDVAMRESGWNQYARNPASGAYGIPQALPPSKMGAAANPPQSNPYAQIAWMISYIRSTYNNPINADIHERAFKWYDKGGWLMPGLTMAVNATGKPERVVGAGEGQDLAELIRDTNALLNELCDLAATAPAETAAGIGAIAGGGGGGRYSGMYSTRG
jgi:hypothetical protein